MALSRVRSGMVVVLCGVALLLITGCPRSDSTGGQARQSNPSVPVAANSARDHSGWWCPEHGIPEEECSMCLPSAKVQTMFKDKGDWCEEHDRAKSQCFLCDPSLKEKYAAKYRAKYGKEPPPIEE